MKTPAQRQGGVLMIEESACIGCQACLAACKLENDLPPGPRPIEALQTGPWETDQGLISRHWPVTCQHCDRPSCVPACPAGAMQKGADGLVFSDPELCIGCRTCAAACPFGHPQLNPASGKIAKCDGCRRRIAAGLWPACALACPTEALSYGTPSLVVAQRRRREAVKIFQIFPALRD
ncbi:MAG: 4Fe-4S dicluster domain-containing protein [Deltaproteobacteria bacterium]|nr:4Fe-4S dicluster domain-containing protein [Deltaproteobacteria bacterium]